MTAIKAEFTIFEEHGSYWYVPKSSEAAAIAQPNLYRGVVHPTNISVCRAALAEAIAAGSVELHLHGVGTTTGIRKEARAKGIKPFVYMASIATKIV